VGGKQKRQFPAIIFPYINVVPAARNTANHAAAVNALPAVPQNTWKWERSTPDKYTIARKYLPKLKTTKD
jgi:hypothetical protein